MSLTELDDGLVRRMAIGAVFSDFGGKIHSVGFHRTDDLLVTSSEDDSLRLFDIANAKQLKITYHKKHGTDRVCFTHHPSSLICSSRYNLESTGESLRYLSMYDNRILRYFKGQKDRVVSLCMSPINDSFMSGSLDRSVRLWDLRVNACQGILHLRGRPAVAYDQQGLVFAIAMEGGAVKLFDSRCYDKGPFDTFLVGGDTAEVNDIKFSNDGKSMLLTTTNNNIYVLDAYRGEKKCGFSLEPSQGTSIEATFTPDGKYVLSGSGDGTLHAWNIENPSEVARWENNIGVVSCLKWAPRRAMFVAASTVLTFWIPNDGEPPVPADPSAGDQQPPPQ
ncbi:PREDICTED: WD repeat-containing protein 82 [Camelina sativa]|uniref:WD repeat-containing protein 82 n=1 Tax=Camelina sativa TaxID=90675 RepID=A0ABM0VB36_CAMSA|nr:PREDICTED: WD repeat-containing protein 82 [Camelina sativa]